MAVESSPLEPSPLTLTIDTPLPPVSHTPPVSPPSHPSSYYQHTPPPIISHIPLLATPLLLPATPLTMQGERHGSRVLSISVGYIASISSLIIVFQSTQLQDAGCGTGHDLPSLIRHQALVVSLPYHNRGRVAIEGTTDGRHRADGEVKVHRLSGELGGTWRGRGKLGNHPSPLSQSSQYRMQQYGTQAG